MPSRWESAPVLGPEQFENARGHEVPKLKNKSAAKKRFSFTATGKVRANQAGKRHGMIKRTNKQIRNQRGTTLLQDCDAKIIRKFLPYGR